MAIKLQAVNQVDVDFLGYSRHDINTVVRARISLSAKNFGAPTGR